MRRNRTVKSLIEQLQKLNPDTEIWGWDDGSIIFHNDITGEDGSIDCQGIVEEIHFNRRGIKSIEPWE